MNFIETGAKTFRERIPHHFEPPWADVVCETGAGLFFQLA
jgi:hypothetical protein